MCLFQSLETNINTANKAIAPLNTMSIESPSPIMLNEYTVIKYIAQGTFGKVLKVNHQKTRQSFAVKKMKYDPSISDDKNRKRELNLLHEGKILTKLNKIRCNDPGQNVIVKCHGIERESSIGAYIVLDLCGHNLLEYVHMHRHQKKKISLVTIRFIAIQLFSAMRFLHDIGGFVHADLKPENISIVYDDCSERGPLHPMPRIKLIDFGNAIPINSTNLSSNYEIQTLSYRAPELLFGNKNDISCAIDMWSVGCILSELYATNLNEEHQFKRMFPSCNEEDYNDLVFKIGNTFAPFPIYVYNLMHSEHYKNIFDFDYCLHIHHREPSYIKTKRNTMWKLRQIFNASNACSPELNSFIDLISCLLDLNPHTRYHATDAMEHQFTLCDHKNTKMKQSKPNIEDNNARQNKIDQQVNKMMNQNNSVNPVIMKQYL